MRITLDKLKPGKNKDIKNQWYARFPVMLDGDIYFVAGNDLFYLNNGSKKPELYFQSTGNLGYLISNHSSKNPMLACVSDEDGGPDLYIFDVQKRNLERVTFFEKDIRIVEFNDQAIYFLSNKDTAFRHELFLYKYDLKTKQVNSENIGPISWYAKPEDAKAYKNYIFQRYGYGYLNWKGYRGGTAGSLWKGDEKLLDIRGNCMRPAYDLGTKRIFFLHDNGKGGNIFSCTQDGKDLTQHTQYQDFQVQDLIYADGKLLYTKGGQIGVYDIAQNNDELLELEGYMPHPDTRSHLPNPQSFLTSIATDGKQVSMAVRGNVFNCELYSGGIQKLNQDLRIRIAGILNNGKTFAFHEPPQASLSVYDNKKKEVKKFKLDTGKITYAKPAPEGDNIAYVNHRHELHIVNYKTGKDTLVFKANQRLGYCDWSGDGEYLVYCASGNVYQSQIVLYNLKKKSNTPLTNGRYYDSSPTFDPDGKYIAFLSNRNLKCIDDGLKFDWAFEHTTQPYIISLQKNQNLLMPWKDEAQEEAKDEDAKEKKEKKKKKKLAIDLDEIQDRIVQLPVSKKNYHNLAALQDAKLMLVSIGGNISEDEYEEAEGGTCVETFCLKNLSLDVAYKNIGYIQLSYNKEYCVLEEEGKTKILKTCEKSEENSYKKSGIFDWARWKFQIDPVEEWKQMAHEAWYLMKEFFWSEQLAGLDWDAIWKKYEPYIDNIRTKQELDDLIGEIHGELGTSHAFILDSGESAQKCAYSRGFLGAEIAYEASTGLHKINKIFKSNWQNDAISPLYAANAEIFEGDYIFSIDGVELNKNNSVDELMINKGGLWITLEIGKNAKSKKEVEVKTICSEKELRYRDWVEANREYVAKVSKGKLGYVHITDMGPAGFKEFYQNYLCEYDKDSIILDVRYNGGGNTSCLLLDQLSRRRLGVDKTRWHGLNELPNESSRGAYVLLTNAHSGSDAEMFSHQFRMLGLGKIIGERTWGGVVGIMPRYRLIDGTLTSQPEFGTWFKDVGYDVENNGVTPDQEVFNDVLKAHDVKNDLQLQQAIEEASKLAGVSYNADVERTEHPKRS